MIIFGQGAIRCHPYVLAELEAARIADQKAALNAFDKAVMKHIGFAISNIVRSLVLGLTSSLSCSSAERPNKSDYFQQATRFSSAFALISDVSMLSIGQ